MRYLQTEETAMNMQIVQTKNSRGEMVWRIIVNGQPHPVEFARHDMALSHMGMLRSRGFAEAPRAA